MTINIDLLTEPELVELNHRVVARIKFLREMRAHAQMLDFSIGDRVSFQPDGYPALSGVLVKYNRKTVSILTDEGQRWNVSPGLLRRAEKPVSPGSRPGAVTHLPNRGK
jgi:hypothetical protein